MAGEKHMTYEEFLKFVRSKCTYETIYDDSDGNTILIISSPISAYHRSGEHL